MDTTGASGIIAWLNANAGALNALTTLALVMVTAVFVRITWNAARRQAVLSEAELFRSLLTEYSQPEMSDALIYLEQWERDNGSDLEAAARKWAERFNFVRGEPGDDDPKPHWQRDNALNDARRRVAYFYQTAGILIDHGYLSEPLASELKALSGRRFLLGVIKAMELAHATAQNRPGGGAEATKIYDRLQRLFGDP